MRKLLNDRHFKDELTKAWFIVGLVFLGLVIPAIVLFWIWGERITHSGNTCAFLAITHLYCPGCGGTRAFNHFVKGHFIRSFLENPFVPYTFVMYIVFVINTALVRMTKKLGSEKFPVTIIIYIGVGVLLLQWVIRNILFVFFGLTVL